MYEALEYSVVLKNKVSCSIMHNNQQQYVPLFFCKIYALSEEVRRGSRLVDVRLKGGFVYSSLSDAKSVSQFPFLYAPLTRKEGGDKFLIGFMFNFLLTETHYQRPLSFSYCSNIYFLYTNYNTRISAIQIHNT